MNGTAGNDALDRAEGTAPDGLILDETGTQRLVGYVVDVGQPDGRARCRLTVGPQHTNRHGVLHGGIAAMLLDSAAGATASLTVDATGRQPFLTVSLNVDFISAGRIGPVTATGRTTGGGRSLLFVASDLVHADGTLIATASGVFKRVPPARTGTHNAPGPGTPPHPGSPPPPHPGTPPPPDSSA